MAATAPVAPTPQSMARESPKPMCATDAEAAAWAADWWAQWLRSNSAKGHDEALYTDAARLLGLLEPRVAGGLEPVKLVRGSWLVRRAWRIKCACTEEERSRLRVPRRQDLERDEPDSLLTPQQAAAMPRGHSGAAFCCYYREQEHRQPLKLVAISHAWLTPEHPDPRGEQLVAFADAVAREKRCCRNGLDVFAFICCLPCGGLIPFGFCYGVPCFGQRCFEPMGAFPGGEFMVFYDYASLHQRDPVAGERSDDERAAFGAALDTMGTWYAHKLATTYALDNLPAGWETTPYGGRGWTTFEAAVSALAKETTFASWNRHVRASQTARQGQGTTRPPPVAPEAFAATLARKVFTNGRSDCELVAGLYANTFDAAFGRAERLIYDSAGWSDAEVEQLARALPLARRARFLDLSGNYRPGIGEVGYRALAAAIEAGGAPRLEVIKPRWDKRAVWPTSDGGALRAACERRGIRLGEASALQDRSPEALSSVSGAI